MNFHYKYIKYKKKYLSQKGSAKSIDVAYQDKLNTFLDTVSTQVLTIELVNSIVNFFKTAAENSYNIEKMHILEDALSKKFVSDYALKNISGKDADNISMSIKKLNDIDYLKWYS